MMACQLAFQNVSFRIIDKKLAPSNNSGALIMQARSLEILQQMGIAGKAINDGIVADKINIVYNEKKISGTSIKTIGGKLSQFPYLLMIEQAKTEKLLIEFLSEKGHSVERGVDFQRFIQNREGSISVVLLPDGSEQSIHSKYLIAADGGNSTIRKLLNIPFVGKTYAKPIFIMDCKAKTDLIPGEISIVFSNSVVAGFFPLHSSRWRIDGTLPREIEEKENLTFKEIQNDFELWTGINFTPQQNEWFSVSHSHQKYAETIRVKNCFLLGDAAHVNTPVGAQGMNTGLQDAYNLAWKLAFVLKHKANQKILDTYLTERSGISRGFARYADTVFKLVTSQNGIVKYFRLYALRSFFRSVFPWINKRKHFRERFFKSISQISIHYRKSILSEHETNNHFLQKSPKPGDRLPFVEFELNGGKTDSFKVRDFSRFNLVVMADNLTDEICKLAEKYDLSLQLIPKQPSTEIVFTCLGITNTGYFLIRPDMHISLRSANMNLRILESYLQRFLIIQK